MHELGLCKIIVDAVIEQMQKRDLPAGSLLSTKIMVGAMRQIVSEQMHFVYEVLTKNTIADGSKLDIRVLPVIIECNACGWKGAIDTPMAYCPECFSVDTKLLQGKELALEKMEVRE